MWLCDLQPGDPNNPLELPASRSPDRYISAKWLGPAAMNLRCFWKTGLWRQVTQWPSSPGKHPVDHHWSRHHRWLMIRHCNNIANRGKMWKNPSGWYEHEHIFCATNYFGSVDSAYGSQSGDPNVLPSSFSTWIDILLQVGISKCSNISQWQQHHWVRVQTPKDRIWIVTFYSFQVNCQRYG